jgi:HPt (histidine-containing phosphotransfer) domain-containing protein
VTDSGITTPGLLNGFGGRIGGSELSQLLSKTLATLEQDYAMLQQLLFEQSWEPAAEKAHQLKGSAYLFECADVVFFLEQITAKNVEFIGTSVFREDLEQQLQSCLGRLQQALDSIVTT